MLLTIIVFLLLLSVLVLIHEAGHYFVAKKLGIKVEEFGFGFPPRMFGIKKGETLYSINWLPIGGFVKLYGEDEAGGGSVKIRNSKSQITKKANDQTLTTKDQERAFFARPVRERLAVVVAGVVMNALLAVVIFYVFFFISGFKTVLPCFGKTTFLLANQVSHCDVIISQVAKNSPAQKLGIVAPAKILAVNNTSIESTQAFQDIILKNKGRVVTIQWEEEKTHKKMTGRTIPRVHPPINQGSLGVAFDASSVVEIAYVTPLQKILSGFVHPINLMIFQFHAIGQLFHQAEKTGDVTPITKNVSGPIGIAALVGLIIQIPNTRELILQMLNLAGLLSVSLAFFNVLPIPALDGGRLFFILIEGVTRHKVNAKLEATIHNIGMGFLLLLIVLITYKDLGQFVFGHGFKP